MLNFFLSESSVRPLFILFPIVLYFFIEYIRRIKKYYYTPVYFPFALESLNPIFAEYYGTNAMNPGVDDSPERVRALEKKAKIDGVISIIISAYIIPLFVGFFSASFLGKSEFYLSFIIIAVIRMNSIFKANSDYNIHHTRFGSKKN